HAAAPWVGAAAFCCGEGSAIFGTFFDTTMQQQVPPELLARVSSLTAFPAYGIGVIGYAIDGPLAAAVGSSAVFAVGAGYGLLSSAAVLALPAVRGVRWPCDSGGTTPCATRAPRAAGGRPGPFRLASAFSRRRGGRRR